MGYALELVEAGEALFTAADVKPHCGIDSDEWDDMLDGYIAAATTHLERILGISIVATTWSYFVDEFDDQIALPIRAASITSVIWTDDVDFPTTLDESDYALVTDETGTSYVRFVSAFDQPTDLAEVKPIAIEFVAGVDAGSVAATLKHAVLLLVAHWFKNREAVTEGGFEELPLGVQRLIGTHWTPVV